MRPARIGTNGTQPEQSEGRKLKKNKQKGIQGAKKKYGKHHNVYRTIGTHAIQKNTQQKQQKQQQLLIQYGEAKSNTGWDERVARGRLVSKGLGKKVQSLTKKNNNNNNNNNNKRREGNEK